MILGKMSSELTFAARYAPTTFPGITESVEAGNQTLAKEWVKRTSDGIVAAAKILATD